MSTTHYISVLRDSNDSNYSPVTKEYRIDPNGTLAKVSLAGKSPTFYDVESIPFTTHEERRDIILALRNEFAFVFNRSLTDGKGIRRLKENFDPEQHGWFFDFDGTIDNQWNITDGPSLYNLLVSQAPEFKDVTYSWNYSSSSNIHYPDGTLASYKCGIHLYFKTDFPVSDEMNKRLGQLFIINGLHEVSSTIATDGSARVYVKPPFDNSVQDTNRFVFESDVILHDGLYKPIPYDIYIVHGSKPTVTKAPSLPEHNSKAYTAIENVLKLNELARIGHVKIKNNRVTGKNSKGKVTSAPIKNWNRVTSNPTDKFFDPKTIEVIDRNGRVIDLSSMSPDSKIPCYVPTSIRGRPDSSPSGYLNRTKKGRYTIYDLSEQVLYKELPQGVSAQSDTVFDIDDKEFSQRYMTRDMFPDDLLNKCIIVKSPMNTGKTTITDQLLNGLLNGNDDEQTVSNQRVIIVVHRETLAVNLTKRLKGFTSYKDKDWKRANKLVFCLDSIWKLKDVPDFKPSVVIVDEIEQVLQHLCSSTVGSKNKYNGGDRKSVVDTLKWIISNAEVVIGMDAGITDDVSIATIAPLLPDGMDIVMIENSYPLNDGKVIDWYEDNRRMLYQYEDDVKAGLVTVYCSDKRINCINLYKRMIADYPTKSFLCLTGDNISPVLYQLTSNVKKGLRSKGIFKIDDETLKYNIDRLLALGVNLIYSPTLGSGFDITTPVDSMTAHFSHNQIPSLNLQQFGRIRNVTGTIRLYRTDNGEQGDFPPFMYGFDGLKETREVAARYFREQGLTVTINHETRIEELNGLDKLIGDLYQRIGWKEYDEKCKGNALLQLLLEEDGYVINEVTDNNLPVANPLPNKAPLYEIDIVNAHDLYDDDVEYLEKKSNLSYEERCQLERYRIASFYKLNDVTVEDVNRDNRGSLMYGILAYESTLKSNDELVENDRKLSMHEAAPMLRSKAVRKELFEAMLPYISTTGKIEDIAFNEDIIESRKIKDEFFYEDANHIRTHLGVSNLSGDATRTVNKILKQFAIKTKRKTMRSDKFEYEFGLVINKDKTDVYRLDVEHWNDVKGIMARRGTVSLSLSVVANVKPGHIKLKGKKLNVNGRVTKIVETMSGKLISTRPDRLTTKKCNVYPFNHSKTKRKCMNVNKEPPDYVLISADSTGEPLPPV